MRAFKATGPSFEQTTLQAVAVSVDTAALGLGANAGTYAMLSTGAAPVNYRTNGALSGPDGASNGSYLPPNSQLVIRIEAGETLNWRHAGTTPGTFNVTLGNLL